MGPMNEAILNTFKEALKELLESLMLAEREAYLQEHPEDKGNGYYERSLLTSLGHIQNLRVPRTREGGFYPEVLPGRRRASVDVEELVLALFSAGLSARKVSEILQRIYGFKYSPSSISRLTERSMEVIDAWRGRPLKPYYVAVVLDATFLKVAQDGVYSKTPVYVALGITPQGYREILGFWVPGTEGEGAEMWLLVLNELRERGVRRVDLFISDGLRGLTEAIKKAFPRAKHQLCQTHLLRRSLSLVRRADQAEVVKELKGMLSANSLEEAKKLLEAFSQRWGKKYPQLVRMWRRSLEGALAHRFLPKETWVYLRTTNHLERVFKTLKKRVYVSEAFPSISSAENILYLVLADLDEKLSKRKLNGWPQEAFTWAEEVSQEEEVSYEETQ